MTIQAVDGPLVTRYATVGTSIGLGIANLNPQQGPNLQAFGDAFLDPRYPFTYFPGGNTTDRSLGFLCTEMQLLNAAPSTPAANNIAASQSPGAGAITLVSSSGAGITVNVTITRADTGAQVVGTAAAPLLAIDGVNTPFSFGQDAAASLWDPRNMLSRTLTVTSGGNDSGITFTFNGYDVYGYPMSETITGPNATSASGNKAFKYVSSVTHTGSVATTVTVGSNTNVIGIPLRFDTFGELRIIYNNAAITSGTTTAAVTTNPATASTGDVRGTYTLASAADGTKRLVVYASPQIQNMASVTGLFGVTQFTSNNNGS